MQYKNLWNPQVVNKPSHREVNTSLKASTTHLLSLYRALKHSRDTQHPISLQINLPRCQTACACCVQHDMHKTGSESKSAQYLQAIKAELALMSLQLGNQKKIRQLSINGSVTYLALEQQLDLMRYLHQCFHFTHDFLNDYKVSLDPSAHNWSSLSQLRQAGVNHLELPVYSSDSSGLSPLRYTRSLIEAARALNFRTISIKLVYGTAQHDEAQHRQTIEQLIWLLPDRIHLTKSANHSFHKCSSLAVSPQLQQDHDDLTAAGYQHLGQGSFVLADDDLNIAYEEDFLQFTDQGYTAHGKTHQIGVGIGATTVIDDFIGQNTTQIQSFLTSSLKPQFNVVQTKLNPNDALIQRIRQDWFCAYNIKFKDLQTLFASSQRSSFHQLLHFFTYLKNAQLIIYTNHRITLTEKGKLIAFSLWQRIQNSFTNG